MKSVKILGWKVFLLAIASGILLVALLKIYPMLAYYFPESQRGIYKGTDFVVVTLSCPDKAFEKFGCPKELVLKVTLGEKACFDFAWFNKPASRIPEALWLGFNPIKPLTTITKLGVQIDPKNVISDGNREMHFVNGNVYFEDIALEAVDLPLLSIDKPCAYSFLNEIPQCDKGVWFNQFNNQWGTNFPMWYEGDARFRYILS